MDRNPEKYFVRIPLKVALRKESVDRNLCHRAVYQVDEVALRKESVDRNWCQLMVRSFIKSLSARRAWIEIKTYGALKHVHQTVALRKESVDRNVRDSQGVGIVTESLSARRAWIEIFTQSVKGFGSLRRSPQGERG